MRKQNENLKSLSKRTTSEQREIASAGGKKSAATRRRKKLLRELLEIAMERPCGDVTTAEAMTVALLKKALSGDVKAFEVVRDTLGQKPAGEIRMNAEVAVLTQEQRDAAVRAVLFGEGE